MNNDLDRRWKEEAKIILGGQFKVFLEGLHYSQNLTKMEVRCTRIILVQNLGCVCRE
jgi:hypothetical protein